MANAVCVARGTTRTVSLLLLLDTDVRVGDHLAVARGHATQVLSPEDAAATWALYDEMLARDAAPAQPAGPGSGPMAQSP